MTQPIPKPALPLPASSDASAVIAEAALSVCWDAKEPSLIQEIHDRIGMVMDAIEHLESVTCEADFHGIDLSFRSLHGVVRLIGREVKMIDALYKAVCKSGEVAP